MSIWRHIFTLVPILVLFILLMLFLYSPKEEPKNNNSPIEDLYKEVENYVTPDNVRVRETCRTILGINWDANFTATDLTLYQEWISKNIALKDTYTKSPEKTLEDGNGNDLSLSLLEYSMILQERPKNDVYLLRVDMMYHGDTTSREHASILCIFGNTIFLSDVTIPSDKIGYVCRMNLPNKVITDIVDNTYISKYNVKYAFNDDEIYKFESNTEFFDWMLFKTGYGG